MTKSPTASVFAWAAAAFVARLEGVLSELLEGVVVPPTATLDAWEASVTRNGYSVAFHALRRGAARDRLFDSRREALVSFPLRASREAASSLIHL